MRIRALHPRAVTIVLVLLLLAPRSASAWSTKEHILLTRIAALRLLNSEQTPPEMKQWLKDALPGLTDMDAERQYLMTARIGPYPRGADGIAFWVVVPDIDAQMGQAQGDRARKVDPFGVSERLLHYIDLEFFMPEEARRVYADDLSNKPTVEQVVRDMKDWRWERAGMLPFRVEQCYNDLVKAIRDGRLVDKPGQFPRDEHATKWAGYLAHYAADNTQPQHATIDYKSQSYFGKDTRRAPNVHADMEYRLVDGEDTDYPELREELWKVLVAALDTVKDPSTSRDPWMATLEVALFSYDALPLIGRAGKAAYPPKEGGETEFNADAFFQFKGDVRGEPTTVLEMKARQMALGVRRIETLWLNAWADAKAQGQATTAE